MAEAFSQAQLIGAGALADLVPAVAVSKEAIVTVEIQNSGTVSSGYRLMRTTTGGADDANGYVAGSITRSRVLPSDGSKKHTFVCVAGQKVRYYGDVAAVVAVASIVTRDPIT